MLWLYTMVFRLKGGRHSPETSHVFHRFNSSWFASGNAKQPGLLLNLRVTVQLAPQSAFSSEKPSCHLTAGHTLREICLERCCINLFFPPKLSATSEVFCMCESPFRHLVEINFPTVRKSEKLLDLLVQKIILLRIFNGWVAVSCVNVPKQL